jgi:hypothetical protein
VGPWKGIMSIVPIVESSIKLTPIKKKGVLAATRTNIASLLKSKKAKSSVHAVSGLSASAVSLGEKIVIGFFVISILRYCIA